MKALTKNLVDPQEFIVHVQGEYDYRFKSDDRERIFKFILDAYKKITGSDLAVFGVRGHLESYITTQAD